MGGRKALTVVVVISLIVVLALFCTLQRYVNVTQKGDGQPCHLIVLGMAAALHKEFLLASIWSLVIGCF